MILCTTQPLSEYSVDHRYGVRVGLGELYSQRPEFFSLISIMSPALYQWEAGSPVPMDARAATYEPYLDRLYTDTLDSIICGHSVREWLNLLPSPTSFYLNMQQCDTSHLPIIQFYDRDQLNLVMRARCHSWIKAQNSPNLESLLSIFTKEDEEEVKENAYGKYA